MELKPNVATRVPGPTPNSLTSAWARRSTRRDTSPYVRAPSAPIARLVADTERIRSNTMCRVIGVLEGIMRYSPVLLTGASIGVSSTVRDHQDEGF